MWPMETTHTSFEQLDDRAEEIEAELADLGLLIHETNEAPRDGDSDYSAKIRQLTDELEQIDAQLAAMSREVG